MWNPYEPLKAKTLLGLGVAAYVILLLVWSTVSGLDLVSSTKLPAPWEILFGLIELGTYDNITQSNRLLVATFASSSRVFLSALLVIVTAIPLGIIMGSSPKINAMVGSILDPFRSAPIVAILPILLIWLGMGETLKMAFLWLGAFVYLVPMTRDAMLGVGRDMYISLKDLGAGDLEAIRFGILPMASPRIWDGIRVSVSVMWTYITVAEYVNAKTGLGYMITLAQRQSRFDHVFGGILVILVLAFITDKALVFAGKKLFPWATE